MFCHNKVKKLPFSLSQKGKFIGFKRLRSQRLISTNVTSGFDISTLKPLTFVLCTQFVESALTQYAFMLADDSFRLLCKLTCRRVASTTRFRVPLFLQRKELSARCICRFAQTPYPYGFLLADDAFHLLRKLICRRVASLLGTKAHL